MNLKFAARRPSSDCDEAITYIIAHYNLSVRIIDIVSHTTYVVCVNFIHKWHVTCSLKSTPNDRFFAKLFMAILFTLRVFARNLLRGKRWRNTFRISFWCLAWDSNPGFLSNKPPHCLLDHSDEAIMSAYYDLKVSEDSFGPMITDFGFQLKIVFWTLSGFNNTALRTIKYSRF